MVCLGLQASKAEEANKNEGVITYTAPCFDTNQLFTELKINYKESPIVLGIASDQAKSTMSLWINPKDKTWTIISTKKDISCVIGSGVDFKILPSNRLPTI